MTVENLNWIFLKKLWFQFQSKKLQGTILAILPQGEFSENPAELQSDFDRSEIWIKTKKNWNVTERLKTRKFEKNRGQRIYKWRSLLKDLQKLYVIDSNWSVGDFFGRIRSSTFVRSSRFNSTKFKSNKSNYVNQENQVEKTYRWVTIERDS